MGIQRQDGYSATVEGFFVYRGDRIRLAKTNRATFVVATPQEIPAGTAGELLIIVDGRAESKRVVLPEGAALGQSVVKYQLDSPN